MIRVLRNWDEIGRSLLSLQRRGLPTHPTIQKNWDHGLLEETLEGLPRDAAVVDLGCGEGCALRFLEGLGFAELHGVDLRIGWRLRVRDLRSRWRRRSWRPAFRLHAGDATRTPFAEGRFRAAISVSTIEHGIDPAAFLREAARIVAPGGLLFVTTDYWPTPAAREPGAAYGLDWQRFDDVRLQDLLATAATCGWEPVEAGDVPPCGEPLVHWNGADYTFLAIAWRRVVQHRGRADAA